MIRLKSWQESVSKGADEQQHRLSDVIPSNLENRQDECAPSRQYKHKKQDIPNDEGDYLDELLKLQRDDKVLVFRFWEGVSSCMAGNVLPDHCYPVQAQSESVRLTEDLFKTPVIDEDGRQMTLYLSIRWLLNQGKLQGRSITGILKGRPLDQGIMQGDMLILHYAVISGTTIFADKFHLY